MSRWFLHVGGRFGADLPNRVTRNELMASPLSCEPRSVFTTRRVDLINRSVATGMSYPGRGVGQG